MSRGRMDSCLLVVVIVLALVLGAALWRGRPDLTAAERERERIKNEALAEKLAIDVRQKEILSSWIVIAKVTAVGLVLVSAAGGILVMLRWFNRRAAEIRPSADGQFPLVRVRLPGGAVAIHDPNRQLAGATVYASPGQADNVVIIPVITGNLSAQERTAARAQLVALTSAAHRQPLIVVPGGRGQAALPATVDADPTGEAPEPVWPTRVPLTGLLNGSTSLARLVIGVTVDQAGRSQVVTGDMARMVHVAVGGSAGWGKSVFMQSLAYQLTQAQERPDLVMVDLDGTTLNPFAGSNRLLYPLADNEADALAIFTALADELERRKALFDQVPGCVDLASYNARVDDPLAPLILLCDEATALLSDKSVETAIKRLALRGRKFWLWLVLAGQDWKASSLDSAIRNQLSTKVQFRANSASQSRVLLQRSGAESLPVPGRALAILPGQDVQEIQAAQISYSDIVAVLAGQSGPQARTPPIDAEVVEAAGQSGLSVQEIETARELLAQGKSLSAITDVIFANRGGRNANRLEKVRRAMESCE